MMNLLGLTISHGNSTNQNTRLWRRFLSFSLLISATLLFTQGCASVDSEDLPDDMSAAEIYKAAKKSLDDSNYGDAVKLYEQIESRYPYGKYSQRAQLEIAYAYYKDNEPETAILSAERFIKLHPNHPNVDYAYYLKGLAAFDVNSSFFTTLFNQDEAERDPKAARKAFKYFADLVQRFPKSQYRNDAIKRMKLLRDNLARYEIYVAQYYMRRKAFLAAVNRAKYVIQNYPKTKSIPDALALMVEGYRKLGLTNLEKDAMRVLQLNHPDHKATQRVMQ